jgi:hypothetical protein
MGKGKKQTKKPAKQAGKAKQKGQLGDRDVERAAGGIAWGGPTMVKAPQS